MKDSLIDSIGYWVVKIIAWFIRLLPLSSALFLGRCAGLVIYYCHKRREVAYINLKHSLSDDYSPSQIREIVKRNYMHAAMMAVELFRFPTVSKKFVDKNIEIKGYDNIENALKKNKGVIFLTAHFGNWELLGIVSSLIGLPIKALAREQKHSKLNDLLNEFRSAHGNEIIGKGFALREIVQALRNNEIVGMVSDQSGGPDGIYLELFGRETTTPTGVINIAQRTECVVLPCFMVRKKKGKHFVSIHPPIEIQNSDDKESDMRDGLSEYLKILEGYIREYPEQWLWGHKRWKYTKNRRCVILSDGKPGHVSQSQGLMNVLESNDSNQEIIFEKEICVINYKSVFHRMLLFILSPVLSFFIQSRVSILRYFLEKSSYENVIKQPADLVISCGSGTVPLSLLVAKENGAKKCVIMKPPFPYNYCKYDLMIVPEHDKFSGSKSKVLKVTTALNIVDRGRILNDGKKLRSDLNIGDKTEVISVFIGGETKKYTFDLEIYKKFLNDLCSFAEKNNFQILFTTSRRTRKDIVNITKEILSNNVLCPLLVIPTEKNIKGIVSAMLGAASIAVVTEDSVSMISEAVSAEKKLMVIKVAEKFNSKKHQAFQAALALKKLIAIGDTRNMLETLEKLNNEESINTVIKKEKDEILNTVNILL